MRVGDTFTSSQTMDNADLKRWRYLSTRSFSSFPTLK